MKFKSIIVSTLLMALALTGCSSMKEVDGETFCKEAKEAAKLNTYNYVVQNGYEYENTNDKEEKTTYENELKLIEGYWVIQKVGPYITISKAATTYSAMVAQYPTLASKIKTYVGGGFKMTLDGRTSVTIQDKSYEAEVKAEIVYNEFAYPTYVYNYTHVSLADFEYKNELKVNLTYKSVN